MAQVITHNRITDSATPHPTPPTPPRSFNAECKTDELALGESESFTYPEKEMSIFYQKVKLDKWRPGGKHYSTWLGEENPRIVELFGASMKSAFSWISSHAAENGREIFLGSTSKWMERHLVPEVCHGRAFCLG